MDVLAEPEYDMPQLRFSALRSQPQGLPDGKPPKPPAAAKTGTKMQTRVTPETESCHADTIVPKPQPLPITSEGLPSHISHAPPKPPRAGKARTRAMALHTSSQERTGATASSLQHFPWFHGALGRVLAEERLKSRLSLQGYFLVRESLSRPGDYSLSICLDGIPRHVRLVAQTCSSNVIASPFIRLTPFPTEEVGRRRGEERTKGKNGRGKTEWRIYCTKATKGVKGQRERAKEREGEGREIEIDR